MSDSKHKAKDANIFCQKNSRRFSCVKAHHLFWGGGWGGGGGGEQKMAVFVVHRFYYCISLVIRQSSFPSNTIPGI